MSVKDAYMAKPTPQTLFTKLNAYTPSESDVMYREVCERCGKEFFFKEKELQDRIIKCPECGEEWVFFRSVYK